MFSRGKRAVPKPKTRNLFVITRMLLFFSNNAICCNWYLMSQKKRRKYFHKYGMLIGLCSLYQIWADVIVKLQFVGELIFNTKKTRCPHVDCEKYKKYKKTNKKHASLNNRMQRCLQPASPCARAYVITVMYGMSARRENTARFLIAFCTSTKICIGGEVAK